jgi:signal transduction histidine kinase
VEHPCAHLADLVRINDMLAWSHDNKGSFISAVAIIKGIIGADIAPTYVLNEACTQLILIANDEERAILGDEYATMPTGAHVRPPWVNPGEWPVSALDHLDSEAWAILPASFKAWFGTSGIVCSMHADGRHLGAVLLCFRHEYVLTQPAREFLAIAGRILGSALYRWQVAARERELGALEERQRISEELHDDLSQQIASLGLRAEMLQLDLRAGDSALLGKDVAELTDMTTRLKRRVRHEMLGLRSDGETVEGSFLDRIHSQIDTFESQCEVPVVGKLPAAAEADRVPLAVGMQLQRVLQEALANAYLHSHATGVVVRLRVAHTKVSLEIEDDGNGFDPDAIPDSRLGVRIMCRRMEQVGGTLEIGPATPRGTRVVAEAPLRSLRRVAIPMEDHR